MNSSSSILDFNAAAPMAIYAPGMNYDYARDAMSVAAVAGNDQSTDGMTESAHARLAQAVRLNNVAAEAMRVETDGGDSTSSSSSSSSSSSNNVSVPPPAEAFRALHRALESLDGISSMMAIAAPTAIASASSPMACYPALPKLAQHDDMNNEFFMDIDAVMTVNDMDTNKHTDKPTIRDGSDKDNKDKDGDSYDEGMTTHSYPLRLKTAEAVSSFSVVRSTVLCNLGLAHVRSGDDASAADCFYRALETATGSSTAGSTCTPVATTHAEPDQDSSNSDLTGAGATIVGIYHNLGHIQYRAERFGDALAAYTEILRMLPYDFSLDAAAAHNCIGVLHFHMAKPDTDAALAHYSRSLDIRRSILGDQHQDVATTLNNIGRVHYMTSDYEAALGVYRRALAVRRTLLGETDLDVAATVYNAGQTLHQLGRLEEAMELYDDFLRIARACLGADHRDISVMLKCVAQIYHEKGQHDRAHQVYEESLRIAREALGPNHAEVASTLNKIGNLHYERGDFDAALDVYSKGLDVERAVLEPDHPNIVVTLTNIGQIYQHRGDHQQAVRMYHDALEIQRRTLGLQHSSVTATLSSIGLVTYQMGNYALALDVYQEVLRTRRDACLKAGTDDDLPVASTLNSIGLVLFKRGVHELAMSAFAEGLRIRRRLLGPDHRDVAIIVYNMATVQLEMGDEEEAMQAYRETLRIERAALGPDHEDVVLTMQHIGQVHQQRGDLRQALEYFEETLVIERRNRARRVAEVTGSGTTTVARTLNHIGNMRLQRGHVSHAMEAYVESARLYNAKAAGADYMTDLVVAGFNFYSLSKDHPEAAPVA